VKDTAHFQKDLRNFSKSREEICSTMSVQMEVIVKSTMYPVQSYTEKDKKVRFLISTVSVHIGLKVAIWKFETVYEVHDSLVDITKQDGILNQICGKVLISYLTNCKIGKSPTSQRFNFITSKIGGPLSLPPIFTFSGKSMNPYPKTSLGSLKL
jgi:hypothetical protein